MLRFLRENLRKIDFFYFLLGFLCIMKYQEYWFKNRACVNIFDITGVN